MQGVIGPYFFEGTVSADTYLTMLQDEVLPVISQWPGSNELVWMHDGAPAHHARTVKDFLNSTFHGRWIGRKRSPHYRCPPPNSSDLTPCDFFWRSFIKSKVYRTKVDKLGPAPHPDPW